MKMKFVFVLGATLWMGCTTAIGQRADQDAAAPPADAGLELIHAAREGDVQRIAALLEDGVDPNIRRTIVVEVYLERPRTPLMAAAEANQAEAVRALIEAGADVELYSDKDHNALLVASEDGSIDAMRALIEAGADIEARNTSGMTPLSYAAYAGGDAVKVLLEAGAIVDAPDEDGDTALYFAVRFGQIESTRLLLRAGANPNMRAEPALTPLHLASGAMGWQTCSLEIARLLIDAGARVDARTSRGMTPFLNAVELGDPLELIVALIDGGADVAARNDKGQNATDLLIKRGYAEAPFRILFEPDVVREAVESGRGVLEVAREHGAAGQRLGTYITQRDLIMAARDGDSEAISHLIEVRADPNGVIDVLSLGSMSPLYMAAGADERNVAKTLLDLGADVSLSVGVHGQPIHRASELGHTQMIRQLVAAGADVNARGENANTPLMSATDRPDTVRELLALGADVNAVTHDGVTPLWFACGDLELDSVRLLLAAGADPNLDRRWGESVLYIATAFSRDEVVEAVKLLLDAGAELERRGEDGRTPLLEAAWWPTSAEVFTLLIKAGADYRARDEDGADVFDILKEKRAAPELIEHVRSLIPIA